MIVFPLISHRECMHVTCYILMPFDGLFMAFSHLGVNSNKVIFGEDNRIIALTFVGFNCTAINS